jgi:hypothetical protein
MVGGSDAVVPRRVPVASGGVDGCDLFFGDLDLGVDGRVLASVDFSPVLVVVEVIRSMMTW